MRAEDVADDDGRVARQHRRVADGEGMAVGARGNLGDVRDARDGLVVEEVQRRDLVERRPVPVQLSDGHQDGRVGVPATGAVLSVEGLDHDRGALVPRWDRHVRRLGLHRLVLCGGQGGHEER